MEKEDTKVDYENENEMNEKSENKQKLTTLYLDKFVKPFSVEDVKAFLLETVPPINTQEHFFMSRNNTYCYVTYQSEEDARKASEYIQTHRFPPQYGGYLHVRFTPVTAASMQSKRSRNMKNEESSDKRQRRDDQAVITLEDLFRKTTTKPVIFYKPLTDKEIEEKKKGKKKGNK